MVLLKFGDRVEHESFPPCIGTVVDVEYRGNDEYLIGVLDEETEAIVRDIESTWKRIESTIIEVDDSRYSDVIEAKIIEVKE
jgi:hypothetical protein|nr:MAG TPA: ATP-dependent DNA helicase [Bacteriophage sp.]